MNRREFLQRSSLLAGAAYLNAPAFAQAIRTLGEPNLIIGILSDIHIREAETAKTFQHALEYFRDQKVDGVVMAGDLADWGLEPQLQVVADTWYRVFPDDKAPDGRHVEKLFVYGNHDVEGYTWNRPDAATAKAQGIGPRREQVWKTCFREDFAPIWFKTVKDYHFIGAHWHNSNIPGLQDFLQQHAEELNNERPFFYIQHPHLKNTCNGPWAWGQDDGTTTRIFSQYPNAVAFSGHSHSPLNDDRDLWQGAFTSIGTASLSYLYPMPARENTYHDDSPLKPPYQMPNMDCSDGRQGMVMRIYDDCLTFERREFVYDQMLDDNWILPWPISRVNPLTFENRGKNAPVPQFSPDAKATVTQAMGKDRYGKEQMQVTVHFPNVLKKYQGVRAFDFEVQVEYQWLDVIFVSATKRVFSPHCYLGEAQDEGEVICVYGEGELPKDRLFRFAIRPCECFGKKGNPIYTDWIDSVAVAYTSTIKTEKRFFQKGENIPISFSNAPVGSDAWIGIYLHGTNPGSSNRSKAWAYTKIKEGKLTLVLQESNEYYAVLFKDGGYTECSERIPIFVTEKAYDETTFKIKTDKSVYEVGDPVRVNIRNAPCLSKDWIGIYALGITPQDVKCPTWLYGSNANETLVMNVKGTQNWTQPLSDGAYFVGYFISDGYSEPFPRHQFIIGKPVLLYSERSKYSSSDDILLRCEGVPTQMTCHLCFQNESGGEWNIVQELTKAEETLNLGQLKAGTYNYCVCFEGKPISKACSFSVTDGSAVNAVQSVEKEEDIFRIDGFKMNQNLSQLPHGIYIKNGAKILR